MVKKLSAWNLFVKKIYAEGKSKNPEYKFKQALADASSRKGEMKNGSNKSVDTNDDVKGKKTKKHKSRKHKKNKTRRKH